MHEIEKNIFDSEELNELRKRAAIETRRNRKDLPRISESSVCHDSISYGSPKVSISENSDGTHKQKSDDKIETDQRAKGEIKHGVSRKASIDSVTANTFLIAKSRNQQDTPFIDKPIATKLSGSLTSTDNAHTAIELKSSRRLSKATLSQLSTSKTQPVGKTPTGIDPRQVFLQLFNPVVDNKEQVILIPETEDVQRSIKFLDYISCFMMHKIGVVYIGLGQVGDNILPIYMSYLSLLNTPFRQTTKRLYC